MNTFLKTALFGLLASRAAARCNNDCNQHGICNAGSTCECERGFVGNDCAERLCYYGEAFVDSPLGDINGNNAIDTDQQVQFLHSNAPVGEQYDPAYGLARNVNTNEWDEGHFYRECSNKGTCNRATGECDCFPGFEGAGCTRLACPDDCSGHGQCVGASFSNANYMAWDQAHTQKCVCDPGYTGPACNMRKCDVGIDPIANVYKNTDSVWKIEFSQWNSTMYDGASMQYLPNGPVHWTMTYTDEMGDEWTTSAVTSYYQTACDGVVADTDIPTASCSATPFHSNYRDSSDTLLVDVTNGQAVGALFYADSAFTFDETFIAEQVNASIAALPNDAARGAYVWVTQVQSGHLVDDNYLIYPSNGVPEQPFTRVDECSSAGDACAFQGAFSGGASLAVNDAQFRFPYFADLETSSNLDATDITNCGFHSLCVFIRLPTAAGTQDLAVQYQYKSEIRTSDVLVGEYSESIGHSSDSTFVAVTEVGSDRFWSVETDGTPRIEYDSSEELHACSRRGLCDYETGLCECFNGYSGYKCEQRSILGY